MPFPLAHSIVGLCYVTKRREQQFKTRDFLVAGLAVIISANAADLDFLPGILLGHPDLFHHGISHSIVAACIAGLAVYWLASRISVALRGRSLLIWCMIAALSHPFLDFISSPYGTPILWPFSSEEYTVRLPFAPFRDVLREGDPGSFLGLIINANNGWQLLVEVFFTATILSGWLAFVHRRSLLSSSLCWVVFALSGVLYYGFQIEPDWIEVREYRIPVHGLERNCILAQLSDMHLSRISFREKRVQAILSRINPDLTLFSGDTFDPFGEGHKISVSQHHKELVEFVSGLPGEKFLVWGEGLCNNRHAIGQLLQQHKVRVLEDEEAVPSGRPEILIAGKLPELALFSIDTEAGGNRYLACGDTSLNSFLHYLSPTSPSWKNYEFGGLMRFDGKGGLGLTFYSQYSRTTDRFYRIRLNDGYRPTVFPHGTGQLSGRITGLNPVRPKVWHRFRIQCETLPDRITIRAKIWEKGQAEPGSWEIECHDGTPLRLSHGTVGIWSRGEGGYRHFDDLYVSALGTNETLIRDSFDYCSFEGTGWRMERKYQDSIVPAGNAAFRLLLTHSPEIMKDYLVSGFNLVLAGGTHGGQVCRPGGVPVWKREFGLPWHEGLHDLPGTDARINISRGIGTSRIPVRLFCRPEISVFHLEPYDSGAKVAQEKLLD